MRRRTFIKSAGISGGTLPFIDCSILSRNNKPKGVMPRKILGKTGIEVSMLGFGSHLKKELIAQPEKRDRMIKLGFEAGINTFDVYDHGYYKQYEPMGKSVKNIRKEIVISIALTRETTEQVQVSLDDALRKFYTDYIDLARIYTADDGIDRMSVLEKNKTTGKIRAIGIASHDAPTLTKYIDTYGNAIDYIMIVYNFHHNIGVPNSNNYPPNDYSALIPRCEKLGMGILGMKPMGSDSMIAFAHTNGYFRNRKANIAQAMLRYVFQKNDIDCTMPAMNSLHEVRLNVEAAYHPGISDDEIRMLNELSARAAATKGAYLEPHYRWLEKWADRYS